MTPKIRDEDNYRTSSRIKQKGKVDYFKLCNGEYDPNIELYENKPARRYTKRSTAKHWKRRRSEDKDLYKPNQSSSILKYKRKRTNAIIKKNQVDNQLQLLLKWRQQQITNQLTAQETSLKVVSVKNILKQDLSKYSHDLQALFINALWKVDTRQGKDGVDVKEFTQFKIPLNLMKNGIVFIWSEKQILSQVMESMIEKGFQYIENFSIIFLDQSKCLQEMNKTDNKEQEQEEIMKSIKQKKKQPKNTQKNGEKIIQKTSVQIEQEKQNIINNTDQIKQVNINNLLLRNDYQYFKKTKHTLLMFRRFGEKNQSLELRHQRTPDVVFELSDQVDPSNIDNIMKEYVYQMIETLLPKALYNNKTDKYFKMMEIFANSEKPRNGWISICEKK